MDTLRLLAGLLLGLAACGCAVQAAGDSSQWDYDHQADWKNVSGTCEGRRQSPVNISSVGALPGSMAGLVPLNMSGWNQAVDGEFENVGSTIKFSPFTGAASVEHHLGVYDLLQFHIHWGRDDTQGSEHKVDSNKYAAEIHFVHQKRGATNTSAGDAFCVVGVLCEADPTLDINTDPWRKFKAPINPDQDENVTGLLYEELLPSGSALPYYHYIGSLTTPPCSEVVQWFLLRDPIKIPSAFLEKLRQIHDRTDANLTYNNRDPQPAYGRQVYLMDSPALRACISSTLLASLALLMAIVLMF